MSAEMKLGFKRTAAGVIPTDWKIHQLVELSSSIASGRSKVDAEFGQFPVFGSTGVIGYTNTPSHTGESILVARVGANAGFLNLADGRYGVTDNTIAIRLKPGSDHIYCLLQLKRYGLSRLIFGSGQPLITGTQLKGIPIPTPAPEEQVKIVSALSEIDALIRSLDQLIAKKRDLQKATMQKLLTGQRRLPGFSGEWEVKRLGDLCTLGIGRTPSRLNDAYWGRGHKWLSIADLKAKVIAESSEEITELAAKQATSIKKGTLLMSFKLSIGRLAFAGCDLFTNEAICSFNDLKANAEYLYYALQRVDFSLYGKQAVKGFTLNKASLKLVEVAIPNMEEQTAIANILSDMDFELTTLETRRDKALQLKQGMMQELLTGRTRLI